jgi:hypothetical protein
MIIFPIISLAFLILFLIGALISFQYFTHFQSLNLLERTHIEDQHQRAQRALGFVVVFSFGAVIALGGILIPTFVGLVPTPIQPNSTDTTLETNSANENNGTPEPIPSISVTPISPGEATLQFTPTSTFLTGTIGNTGGAGANIRSSPGLAGTIIETLPDGSRVILLGESQQADGFDWQFIEIPDTRDGWVVVQFIIPDN